MCGARKELVDHTGCVLIALEKRNVVEGARGGRSVHEEHHSVTTTGERGEGLQAEDGWRAESI